MSSYRDEVEAYLDGKKDEMIADLEKLMRIESRRGEEKPGMPFGEGPAKAVAAAEEMMKGYGFTVTNYDNYVVTADLSDKEKALDILAHLDVVPVTDDWTVTKPFEPKIVDGKIYGRGSSDDKGPAIAALYALRAIKDLNIPMKHSVRLILGSDEECGSGDLARYYQIEKEAPYSFTPDADFPLINIEKGRMEAHFEASFPEDEREKLPRIKSFTSGDKANVVPGKAVFSVEGVSADVLNNAVKETEAETGVSFTVTEEGSDLFTVEAKGLAAHASLPEEGKNALTASLRLITRLPLADTEGAKALSALDLLLPYEDTRGEKLGIYSREERSGETTVCFSILSYTPEGLTGTFDARLPIGCTDENTRLPAADLMGRYGITLLDEPMVKPHCVPGDSEFVKILLDSYEHYSGRKGEALSTGGGTYVHELERGVAFGCMMPDVDNHMHGDDEFMVIDTLMMSAKIFADAVIRICNDLPL